VIVVLLRGPSFDKASQHSLREYLRLLLENVMAAVINHAGLHIFAQRPDIRSIFGGQAGHDIDAVGPSSGESLPRTRVDRVG
jgi:hypothetical protein